MHEDYDPKEIEERKVKSALERWCLMSIEEQQAELERLAKIKTNHSEVLLDESL